VTECYFHKFAGGPQCQEPAVYASAHLGNIVDGWTWCIYHPPGKDFRVLIAPSPSAGLVPGEKEQT